MIEKGGRGSPFFAFKKFLKKSKKSLFFCVKKVEITCGMLYNWHITGILKQNISDIQQFKL